LNSNTSFYKITLEALIRSGVFCCLSRRVIHFEVLYALCCCSRVVDFRGQWLFRLLSWERRQ